jgi:hypothetical protein
MKNVIRTYCSHGEAQPFAKFALDLQRAGQGVLLAAPHRN